jgi:hypothetical protein
MTDVLRTFEADFQDRFGQGDEMKRKKAKRQLDAWIEILSTLPDVQSLGHLLRHVPHDRAEEFVAQLRSIGMSLTQRADDVSYRIMDENEDEGV